MSSRLIGFGVLLSLAGAVAFVTPAAAQWRGYSGYQPYAPGYGDDVPEQDNAPPPRTGRRAYPSQNDPYAGASYGGPSYPEDPYQTQFPASGGGVSAGRADDSALNAASSERTGTMVTNPTRQPPGTIVVDTRSRHLYLVLADGNAMQYGIGVGRQGFSWKGEARVQRKAEWPAWYPPAEMIKRRPDLPEHMEGGIDNPLGARALYLYQGNKDTLFRIHGTNEPDTIGKAVSSGCIRMMNNDVVDLYNRVPAGTRVVVL